MIKQLILKNFQSHRDTTIEFSKNFSCIVGSGNSGKSSIVRALSLVLFNEWDKSWVRHGSSFCEVTIWLENGIIIKREKGEKVNRYEVTYIDGRKELFENFGKEVPKSIVDILNVFPVALDLGKINFVLSNQHEPLFLLNEPGSLRAKLIGKLSGAYLVDYAIRDLNKDIKQSKIEKSVIETEIVSKQEKLKDFEGIDDKINRLDAIKSNISLLEVKEKRIEELKEVSLQINNWKDRNATTEHISELLSVVDVSSFDSILNTYTKYKEIKEVSLQINDWKSQFDSVENYCDKLHSIDLTTFDNILNNHIRYSELMELLHLIEKNTNDISSKTGILNQIILDKTNKLNKLITILKDNKKCPTCFSKITDGLINTIQEEMA